MKHIFTAFKLVPIASVIALVGCGKQPLDITNFGLIDSAMHTHEYTIQSAFKSSEPAEEIYIHIEGDGYAYVSKRRASLNPTPTESVMLDFMKYAPQNSIYLARPCQFIRDKSCQISDWTTERYANRHTTALDESIDKIKAKFQAKSIILIGHSGGGTMATLIANKRKKDGKSDIKGIITLAGNLNISGFTTHHRVSPMLGADPANIAPHIKDIPQIHYIGSDDQVVPGSLSYKYMINSGRACVSFKTLQGVSHAKGWNTFAENIYKNTPKCKEHK